jgi:RNA-binding protein YlmH
MEIDYPEKFVTLKHQHILGTLMSLGIEREQVGDIIVNERIQFVLTSRLESFIMLEYLKELTVALSIFQFSLDCIISVTGIV